MEVSELKDYGMPDFLIERFIKSNIIKLNPAQEKSIKKGIFDRKNLVVCTPTGSGKTVIATFAIVKNFILEKGKAVYIVPLKALASEKLKEYKELFKDNYSVALSTGDIDSSSEYLAKYDLIILTVEKMDSLIRHKSSWLNSVGCVIIDEIHLMNDIERGPTLEILITILKKLLKNVQIVALSATIGNPEQLAKWLDAELVIDDWRPVKLHKGVYFGGEVEFH